MRFSAPTSVLLALAVQSLGVAGRAINTEPAPEAFDLTTREDGLDYSNCASIRASCDALPQDSSLPDDCQNLDETCEFIDALWIPKRGLPKLPTIKISVHTVPHTVPHTIPTKAPTEHTVEPTKEPTQEPTQQPTKEPTQEPTKEPTPVKTGSTDPTSVPICGRDGLVGRADCLPANAQPAANIKIPKDYVDTFKEIATATKDKIPKDQFTLWSSKEGSAMIKLADDWAGQNGKYTVNMLKKKYYKNKNPTTKGGYRPFWSIASAGICSNAKGDVRILLDESGIVKKTILFQTEWPQLMANQEVKRLIWVQVDKDAMENNKPLKEGVFWKRGDSTVCPINTALNKLPNKGPV